MPFLIILTSRVLTPYYITTYCQRLFSANISSYSGFGMVLWKHMDSDAIWCVWGWAFQYLHQTVEIMSNIFHDCMSLVIVFASSDIGENGWTKLPSSRSTEIKLPWTTFASVSGFGMDYFSCFTFLPPLRWNRYYIPSSARLILFYGGFPVFGQYVASFCSNSPRLDFSSVSSSMPWGRLSRMAVSCLTLSWHSIIASSWHFSLSTILWYVCHALT